MYALDLDDFLDEPLPSTAVVGSREFPDVALIADFVRGLPPGTEVVSGGARGVDRIAERVARALRYDVRVFPPAIPPGTNGRTPEGRRAVVRALFERNEEIVYHATEVVAFWDGHSKGTQHAIAAAVRRGRRVRVYLPRPHGVTTSEWLGDERAATVLACDVADRYRLARPRRRL